MKPCLSCGVYKSPEEFPFTSSAQRWRRGTCRFCRTLANRCRKFGITVDQYVDALIAQDGKCAICGEPEALGRELAIDHDHETGRFRGLLCFICNTRIAWLEDVDFVDRALAYIKGGHNISDSIPVQLKLAA